MDPLLLIASIISTTILAVSMIDFTRRAKRARRIRIEPKKLDIKIRAGERGEILLKAYTETPFKVEEDLEWLSCDSKVIEPPSSLLRFKIGSNLSGKHELTGLRIGVYDFLELFRSHVKLPLTLKAIVSPRVIPGIIEGLRLLVGELAGLGETPGKRKGHGLEY